MFLNFFHFTETCFMVFSFFSKGKAPLICLRHMALYKCLLIDWFIDLSIYRFIDLLIYWFIDLLEMYFCAAFDVSRRFGQRDRRSAAQVRRLQVAQSGSTVAQPHNGHAPGHRPDCPWRAEPRPEWGHPDSGQHFQHDVTGHARLVPQRSHLLASSDLLSKRRLFSP